MFGNQVRGERQQEQQDDLRRRFITTPAAKEAQRASVQPAHYEAREDTANRHLEEFQGRAAYGKDHRAHGNRHGKLQGDQARGVVHQRLALQNAHDFLWNAPFTHNAGQRHGVGRRQHGSQRKGGDERDPWYGPVDQETNPDHGDDHQRQRQAEDLSPVLQKFARRRFPAIGKQQRRDKQHEKQFRIELHVQTERRPRQQRADSYLH